MCAWMAEQVGDAGRVVAADIDTRFLDDAAWPGVEVRELDLRSDKISYKVREHSLAKVPLILAVGGREAEQGTVAVRRLGNQKQESLALDEAVALFVKEAWPPDVVREG